MLGAEVLVCWRQGFSRENARCETWPTRGKERAMQMYTELKRKLGLGIPSVTAAWQRVEMCSRFGILRDLWKFFGANTSLFPSGLQFSLGTWQKAEGQTNKQTKPL
uniref:Uncharacterized protein n=1 Tax=Mus spicilegus TaxID=10103 RepID=A0A8C6IC36_MUSSI